MNFFKIDERLNLKAEKVLFDCDEMFRQIDSVTEYNQQKVLS